MLMLWLEIVMPVTHNAAIAGRRDPPALVRGDSVLQLVNDSDTQC